MRIVIADDEPVALARLELALAQVDDARVAGKAKTGAEAAAMIRKLKPDIAVLDVQMPAGDGFSILTDLDSVTHIPEVIFVTAHHDYALRAFEVGAVDYLLKPVAL